MLDLKIYNRWGEMVFQTSDPREGWDGTYNGTPQEMEVYFYVMSGKFVNDEEFSKQGNVTLLR
jgi:gliding motility-associated-like protein